MSLLRPQRHRRLSARAFPSAFWSCHVSIVLLFIGSHQLARELNTWWVTAVMLSMSTYSRRHISSESAFLGLDPGTAIVKVYKWISQCFACWTCSGGTKLEWHRYHEARSFSRQLFGNLSICDAELEGSGEALTAVRPTREMKPTCTAVHVWD